jgi:hypothetical protein
MRSKKRNSSKSRFESKSEDFFRSRFMLFLSADLVGSTAFKQANSSLGMNGLDAAAGNRSFFAPWASEIANFYRLFPHTFKTELSRTCDKLQSTLGSEFSFGDEPELWKAVGDELIFKKEISNSKQVAVTILAWIHTLNIIKQKLTPRTNLSLKSFVWTAGFPVMNNEIIFERSIDNDSDQGENLVAQQISLLKKSYDKKQEKNFFSDYLGPSIDTGFRIGSYATPRKLILSVEVAHILARYNEILGDDCSRFKPIFYFDNYVELKGVFGGAQYPIFWLDLLFDRDINSYENKLLNREGVSPDTVIAFAKAFYSEHKSYIFKPFIDQDKGDFAEKPSDYDNRYAKWKEEINQLLRAENLAPDNSLCSDGDLTGSADLDDAALEKMSPISVS